MNYHRGSGTIIKYRLSEIMKTSFKLIKNQEVEDNIIYRIMRWITYFVIGAILLWPALFVLGVAVALIVAVLAIVLVIAILLIPIGIVGRLFRLI